MTFRHLYPNRLTVNRPPHPHTTPSYISSGSLANTLTKRDVRPKPTPHVLIFSLLSFNSLFCRILRAGHFSASCSQAVSLLGHHQQQTIKASHDAPTWIRARGALPSYDQVSAHGYSRVLQLLTALGLACWNLRRCCWVPSAGTVFQNDDATFLRHGGQHPATLSHFL